MVLAGVAHAQVEPDEGPETAVSDAELVRWASREVGEPALVRVPPPPPDAYHAAAPRTALTLADTPDRDLERILAEIGGGALGMLIGGGLGTLAIWLATQSSAEPEWAMLAAGSGSALAAIGVSAGVALGADAAGGRGNYGYAFLGQALGALAALPLVVAALDRGEPGLAIVPAGVLPLCGAVLGYELGLLAQGQRAGAFASIAPLRDGVLVTAAGAF